MVNTFSVWEFWTTFQEIPFSPEIFRIFLLNGKQPKQGAISESKSEVFVMVICSSLHVNESYFS